MNSVEKVEDTIHSNFTGYRAGRFGRVIGALQTNCKLYRRTNHLNLESRSCCVDSENDLKREKSIESHKKLGGSGKFNVSRSDAYLQSKINLTKTKLNRQCQASPENQRTRAIIDQKSFGSVPFWCAVHSMSTVRCKVIHVLVSYEAV